MKIFFLILMLSSAAFSYGDQKIYEIGREFDSSNYKRAFDLGLELIKDNSSSGELYYNMGVISYKLNNLGEAIYYTKKAKQLLPRDPDVDYNLRFLQSKTIDKVVSKKSFFNSISMKSVLNMKEEWMFFTVFTLLLLLLATIYIYKKSRVLKVMLQLGSVLYIPIFLMFVSDNLSCNKFGVVTKSANVYSSTSLQSVHLFTLNVGTEFDLKESDSTGWIMVELEDGKKGWMRSENSIY